MGDQTVLPYIIGGFFIDFFSCFRPFRAAPFFYKMDNFFKSFLFPVSLVTYSPKSCPDYLVTSSKTPLSSSCCNSAVMKYDKNINDSIHRQFQIVASTASTASTLEEPFLILVNKLPFAIASIFLASNCLRNRVTQFKLCPQAG